jgi:NAD-dependent deacetylase
MSEIPLDQSAVAQLAALITSAESAVVLTGAGISVPSGIPDFRSPGTGLWTNMDPMTIAHIDVFRTDPKRFWEFYAQRFHILGDKQPNRAHMLLAEWEERGHVEAVITQNIDRLHAKAGTRELIEMHGSIERSRCLICQRTYDYDEVTRRIESDRDGIPRCDCWEPLKPDVVLFGEELPFLSTVRAEAYAQDADLLLCVGSSLEVYPVAELPMKTLRHGGQIAIVTKSETEYDSLAAIRLDGDVVTVLEAVDELL